jgi:hypothetical protein
MAQVPLGGVDANKNAQKAAANAAYAISIAVKAFAAAEEAAEKVNKLGAASGSKPKSPNKPKFVPFTGKGRHAKRLLQPMGMAQISSRLNQLSITLRRRRAAAAAEKRMSTPEAVALAAAEKVTRNAKVAADQAKKAEQNAKAAANKAAANAKAAANKAAANAAAAVEADAENLAYALNRAALATNNNRREFNRRLAELNKLREKIKKLQTPEFRWKHEDLEVTQRRLLNLKRNIAKFANASRAKAQEMMKRTAQAARIREQSERFREKKPSAVKRAANSSRSQNAQLAERRAAMVREQAAERLRARHLAKKATTTAKKFINKLKTKRQATLAERQANAVLNDILNNMAPRQVERPLLPSGIIKRSQLSPNARRRLNAKQHKN